MCVCVRAVVHVCMHARTHARTHACTHARVCEGFARVLRRTGYVSNSTLSLTRPDAYSSCATDDCVLISSMSAVDPPSRHLDGSMIGQRLHALLQREVRPKPHNLNPTTQTKRNPNQSLKPRPYLKT